MYAHVETEITERDEELKKLLENDYKLPLSREHTDTSICCRNYQFSRNR